MSISGAPVTDTSSSLPNLFYSGIKIGEARRAIFDQTNHTEIARATPEVIKFSKFMPGLVSLFDNKDRSSRERQLNISPLRRLLDFIIWWISCISLNLASGLFVILRAMLSSRVYTLATRLGLGSSLQQDTRLHEEASSVLVLQDRLETANLAVKQLKSESLLLQEKLKAAGERIAKLEANQADYVAFQALQAKYDQVSAEISHLTREDEELRSNGLRLVKENAELRQCLAMKDPDVEEDTGHLGMLARLQNQQLDSCIFPKDDETSGMDDNKDGSNERSEDSIVIFTGVLSPKTKTNVFSIRSASAPVPAVPSLENAEQHFIYQGPTNPANSASTQFSFTPQINIAAPPQPENASPIPVFTTTRPSLPPKVSKPQQLKPLLLTSRSATSGSPRRHVPKHASMRKHYFKLAENTTIRISAPRNIGSTTAHAHVHTLNPCAAAFMPRSDFSNNAAPVNNIGMNPSSAQMFHSPVFSPFIYNSPSPNSPFLRPPPTRRLTEDTAFPTFTTTPPTPTTPNPVSPFGPVGTPRSTRASSVRLIRVRAAMRNSQRIASGSSAVAAGEPAGLETVVRFGAKNAHAKERLVGKGMPPRRVLGEVTNAEDAGASRWTSV